MSLAPKPDQIRRCRIENASQGSRVTIRILFLFLSCLPAWVATAGDVSRYLPSTGLRPINAERLPAPNWAPDLMLEAAEGFKIGKEGPEVVRSFVIPVENLPGAVYIEAIQLTPAASGVVTHAVVRLDTTLDSRKADEKDPGVGFADHPQYSGVRRPTSLVAAWTPFAPVVSAPSAVWRMVPDSDLVVTCVIKPNGKEAEVRPKVSLWLAPQPTDSHLLTLRMANEAIDIQPGSEDISARDAFRLPVPAKILALYADANHAARAIRFDLTGPFTEKGEPVAERLFEIADWEAGLQEWYRFEKPVEVTEGSRLDLQIRYANPKGDKPIRWGPRPEDERGELYVLLSVENDRDMYELMKLASVHQLALTIEGAEAKGADDLFSHVQLAKLYADSGQVETAVAHGLKAVSLDGASAEARAALGAAYVTQNHDFSAQEQLEQAIKLNPDLADAHYNLGNVFLRYGVLEKAFNAYEKAAQLDPRDVRFANNLGHLMMQRDRNKDAEVIFHRVIERNPYHAPATANLARIKELNGDRAGALVLYKRAVTLAPAMGPTLQPLINRAEESLKKK